MTVSFHRFIKPIFWLSAFLLSLVASGPAFAEEHGETEHHFPRNVVGVFLGATDADTTELTIGVEFEHRFTEKFGLGVVVEHTPDAHHKDGVSVALAAVHFHPGGGFRLTGGIGFEEIHGAHGHTNTLYRVGVAYDIEMGSFALAPTINVDFIDGEEAIVFGVVLSRHF